MTPRNVAAFIPCLALAAACSGSVSQSPNEVQAGAAGKGGNISGPGGAAGLGGTAGLGGAPHGGAGGAAGNGVGGTSPACVHSIPAQPPSITNAGGDLDLVFAFSSVSFSGAQPIGLDLDLTCTCEGEADSCLAPSWATQSRCDGFDGIDNAFASLMTELATLVPEFSDSGWNASLASGSWSVLLRIRNYNGAANDDAVELDWYVPLAFDAGLPKMDGSDVWKINGASMENGNPKYADSKAYVSNGTLVARLPSAMLQPPTWMNMRLTDPVVSGRLQLTAAGWQLQGGNIAAVWTLDDIFGRLSDLRISGQPLCADAGNPIYSTVKNMFCSRTDIYRAAGMPSTQCDSLSVGLGFEGVAAILGQVRPPPIESEPCDLQHDPANDTCGK